MKIMLVIVLILSLCTVMTSCNIYGPSVVPNEDETNNNNNNNNNEDKDNNNNNNNPTVNPYKEIINSLLEQISGISSMEGYVSALMTLLEVIPIDIVKNAVGGIAGEEKAEMVEEYYGIGLAAMEKVNLILPLVPKIKAIMNFLELMDAASIPILVEGANAVLEGVGIEKNGNTYSYTYEEVLYTVEKNDNIYTVSFDDKTSIRTIILEYEEDHYKITESGIMYDVEYNDANKNLSFSLTNVDDGVVMYEFQSVNIVDDFALQIHDVENERLVQMLTNVALLEVTVSIQTEDIELSDISEGRLPEDFATKGEVYIINEGVVAPYLSLIR